MTQDHLTPPSKATAPPPPPQASHPPPPPAHHPPPYMTGPPPPHPYYTPYYHHPPPPPHGPPPPVSPAKGPNGEEAPRPQYPAQSPPPRYPNSTEASPSAAAPEAPPYPGHPPPDPYADPHYDAWRNMHYSQRPPPPGMVRHPREPPPPPGYHWPHPPPPPPYYWQPARAAAENQPPHHHHHHHHSAHPPTKKDREADARAGATSPSQIENHHREDVQNMGCTCKKTRCLKLYCQCFGAKLFCGPNCRCLTCNNTEKYDKIRKEAMRSILLRNPAAFDTKFKKNLQAAAAAEQQQQQQQRMLAHKLGCKCRKSACMKKYCECYAGNVKCSASCRCMGCKNVGGGPRNPPPPPPYDRDSFPTIAPHPRHHAQAAAIRPPRPPRTTPASTNEPWLAAQNLTFLKRGSPEVSKRKVMAGEGEIASMPSLASSSEGTSPGQQQDQHKHDEGAKALLMAAVAMTEFGQSPTNNNPAAAATSTPTKKRPTTETTSTPDNNNKRPKTKLSPQTPVQPTQVHYV